MAVLDSGTTPAAKPPMTFAVRETGSLVEKEAADKIRISDLEPRSMAPLLRDPNPFVRLKALTIIVQIQRKAAPSGPGYWDRRLRTRSYPSGGLQSA